MNLNINWKAVLKWAASLGAGAAVAGLQYVGAHAGTIHITSDPIVNGVIATLVVKLTAWLVGKIPVKSQTSQTETTNVSKA